MERNILSFDVWRGKLSECLRIFLCWSDFWIRHWTFLQPLIRSPYLLATWITPTTRPWWHLSWMFMSSATSCGSLASESSPCWIWPGRRCLLLLRSSFISLTKAFMVSVINFFFPAYFFWKKLLSLAEFQYSAAVLRKCWYYYLEVYVAPKAL